MRSEFKVNSMDRKSERGVTLIELMIALLMLAVGVGGLTGLLIAIMNSDSRNAKDTTATLLAQMVIEQITAQHPSSNTAVTVTDCAGNSWTINVQDGASPSGTGANLVTSSSAANYGGIDFTQSYASVTSGYAMKYVECSSNGSPLTYDVRWNVMTMDSGYTRLVTAAAKPLNATASSLGGRFYTVPVTLRAVAAP